MLTVRGRFVDTFLECDAIKPGHLPQAVENRASHSMPGKCGKLQPSRLIKSAESFEQSDLAIGDQVVQIDVMRNTSVQFPGDRTDKPLMRKELVISALCLIHRTAPPTYRSQKLENRGFTRDALSMLPSFSGKHSHFAWKTPP